MHPDEVFRRAYAALQAGKAADAERSFKKLLSLQPRHTAGLNLYCILLAQQGRYREAEPYAARAAEQSASSDATLYNHGTILKALGRHAEALARFDQALAIKPNVAETWNNRGLVLLELDREREAITSFERATQLNPHFADAFANCGKALSALHLHERALGAYDRALALKPDLAEAYVGRAATLIQRDRHADALSDCDRAIALRPQLADSWLVKSKVLLGQKHYDAASGALERALALNPKLAEAWVSKGKVHAAQEQHAEAVAAFDKALDIEPRAVSALSGKAALCFTLKRYDEALAGFDRALQLKPDSAECHLGRGNIFVVRKEYDAALAEYERALALRPNLAEAYGARGHAFFECKHFDRALTDNDKALALSPNSVAAWLSRGTIEKELKHPSEAFHAFDRAFAIDPESSYAEGARLTAKLQLCDWSRYEEETQRLLQHVRARKPACTPFDLICLPSTAQDQLACAEQYMRRMTAPAKHRVHQPRVHDRIRVAYLSADFHDHATAHLMANLFEQHDRSKFEFSAISFGPSSDTDMRKRLEASFEHFIDVQTRSDDAICALLQTLEIDIAVDLKGYTLDSRPNIFAARPAPIQVNYLGYPGTLGGAHMDYILADPTVIPVDHFRYYSEQVVWLPDSYQVNDPHRPISDDAPSSEECGLPDGSFVFCCFNNVIKIQPDIFGLWMDLLKGTENSVLWLIAADPAAIANLRREAEARNIDATRLIFAPNLPLSKHLGRHRHADLVLDTLPCNAHTTASDALWAGVPVLTCLGATFAGRVAASLLTAVGLPELITTSPDDYAAMALRLAREPALLASLKERLAKNRTACPLFNAERFARHIETAYTVMWERYQRQEAPTHFVIDRLDG